MARRTRIGDDPPPGFEERLLKNLGIGPTGDYPAGKLGPDDEGGIAIGVSNTGKLVRIDFGTPCRWIAFPKEQAQELARLILKHAEDLE